MIAAVLNSLPVLANYNRGMVGMFAFAVLLTTLSNAVAYLFCALADVALAYRDGWPVPLRDAPLACAAFGFSIRAVVGAGADVALLEPYPAGAWVVGLRVANATCCVDHCVRPPLRRSRGEPAYWPMWRSALPAIRLRSICSSVTLLVSGTRQTMSAMNTTLKAA